MKAAKKIPLSVPRLTEIEGEAVKQGLMCKDEVTRAATFTTIFGKVIPIVPVNVRANVKDAATWQKNVATAYDVVGGPGRLAQWADENYSLFVIHVLGKTFAAAPSIGVQASGNIIFQSGLAVPPKATEPLKQIEAVDEDDDE
jgi:hypothetical protein